MPDPRRETISSTEMSALFGVSSYATRWMLYNQFTGRATTTREPSSRMDWGTKLQPLIIDQVAKEQRLEVFPNVDNSYVRRGLLGCTRDATIVCPDRGPGALEIKSVFDYKQWNDKWGNGNAVPREYEIQLQHQMYVGDGGSSRRSEGQYKWGVIAVWVCAEMYYFERQPIYDLWEKMEKEAIKFFLECHGEEPAPSPFGNSLEIPELTRIYSNEKGAILDLSNDYNHIKTSEDVAMYKHLKETETGAKYTAENMRARFLALAENYQIVKLPCGVNYKVVKAGTGKRLDVYVPENPTPPPPPPELGAGLV